MKAISKSIFTLLFLTLFLGGFSNEAIFAQANRTITGNSAGSIRIGMTVTEARNAMRGYTFRRTSDGEGIALIEVRRRNQIHMTLYAGEFDPDQPINNAAKIEFIEVWNRIYKTAAGVHPQMLVRDVERRYGKLSSIMTSEIESREYGRFTNQPGNIDLRLEARNNTAGVYAQDETNTTRYSPTAYVRSIIVIGGSATPIGDGGNTDDTNEDNNNGNDNNTGNTNFTSLYSDLRANCRTPRTQNGGHVSTYCQGQGDYQVHIFDTATTMEIRVESKDKSKSINVASQSLRFNRNNQKIEWRMKDGKPFAVIMRGYKYRLNDDGLIRYPEQRTGEYLFVKGLPGYERIDYEVDVRTTGNANEKAREMADKGFAGENPGTGNNNSYQTVNINRFNRIIDIANRNRETWVRSPSQTVYKLIGEIQDAKSRVIRFEFPSAEGSNSITAVITEDGLLDDSTRSQRLRLQLGRDSSGIWKVISGRQSWRCQQGRGHQNFSAVPCS